MRCTAALALLAAWSALGAMQAHAQGLGPWPQFQGASGHPGALEGAPEPPYRQAWRFSPPQGALSGATIVGDVAISVGEKAVYGIDLATGQERWSILREGGPLSMPAVGTVGGASVLTYLEKTTSDEMRLVGVDLPSKKERWHTALKTTARSGVTIDDGTAFVGDQDGNVSAVDLDTGGLRWTASSIGRIEGPVAVADGKVYVVSRDSSSQQVELDAFDESSGDKAWTFTPKLGGATATIPAAEDGLAVIASADRLVYGVAANDGVERWSSLGLTLFSPVSGAALQPDAAYVADVSGGIYRVDPSNGERVWDHQLNELIVRSSPVLTGSDVLIGLNDGRLVALDAASGNLVWESTSSAGLIGTISLSPTTIVAVKGGSKAGLVGFVHDPSGHLVDVPSPTKVDLGRLTGNFAAAFAVCTLALYAPFRLLRRRFGSAVPDAGALDASDEDLDEGSGVEDDDDRGGEDA